MNYTWGYIKDCTLAKLDLDMDSQHEATEMRFLSRFPFYANEAITQISSAVKPMLAFVEILILEQDVEDGPKIIDILPLVNGFISFNDDICTITQDGITRETSDEDFIYRGQSKLMFFTPGTYSICYNARWITFDKSVDDNLELEIPMDILDCIPSYIASQCYKIDDEYKSAVFRNEYELALSRIDNTNYKTSSTFAIRGDW